VSAGDIIRWHYKDTLIWCADRDGILRRDRLKQVQRAREYARGWIDRLNGRHWEDVYGESVDWWKERRRRERDR
jgi:hypothetical protein